MTLIRAVGTGSVYRSKNKAVYAPFALRTSNKRVNRKALLDSGATECFISPRVVRELGMKTRKLHTPRNVRNIDGTSNKSGKIVDAIDLVINHRGNQATHVFFVTDIGPDDFIFGYPFLEANAPNVDWLKASLEDSTTASTLDAERCCILPKRTTQKRKAPLWVRTLPGWVPGDEVWQQVTLRKTTVPQQLADDALEGKEEKTWQQLVPERYHRAVGVFKKKNSEKFTNRRPFDHAINLKDNAPAAIN